MVVKSIRVIAVFLLLQQSVFAQDIHLSQFYTNQQNLNPALGGSYDGIYQLVSNYRNQWRQLGGSPIVTTMAGFNHKFYYKNDEISGGLLLVQDQFSSFGLNTSKILIGGSYEKKWYNHEFKVGTQIGFTFRSMDLSNQTFPNQWVRQNGIFDRNVDNLENNLLNSQRFFDVNIGFAWSKQFDGYKPVAGISFFHVNEPIDTYFKDGGQQLRMRTVFHASILKNIEESISIEPKLLYMFGNNTQDLLVGGNVYKKLENSLLSTLQTGLLYRGGFGRNSDAIIAIIGGSYRNVNVGLSYDFNVGPLNNVGTYELSFVYTAPSFRSKKITIPCDRY